MKKLLGCITLPGKSTASLTMLAILFFLAGCFISSCKSLQINRYVNGFNNYKGKEFPAIPLLDTADNVVYLKSTSATVKYVDMWSKHCVPCVTEFKLVPALTQRFKGQNIEFVYICTQPLSKEAWLNDVKKYGLEHGTHYYINDSLYNIYEKAIDMISPAGVSQLSPVKCRRRIFRI